MVAWCWLNRCALTAVPFPTVLVVWLAGVAGSTVIAVLVVFRPLSSAFPNFRDNRFGVRVYCEHH